MKLSSWVWSIDELDSSSQNPPEKSINRWVLVICGNKTFFSKRFSIAFLQFTVGRRSTRFFSSDQRVSVNFSALFFFFASQYKPLLRWTSIRQWWTSKHTPFHCLSLVYLRSAFLCNPIPWVLSLFNSFVKFQ